MCRESALARRVPRRLARRGSPLIPKAGSIQQAEGLFGCVVEPLRRRLRLGDQFQALKEDEEEAGEGAGVLLSRQLPLSLRSLQRGRQSRLEPVPSHLHPPGHEAVGGQPLRCGVRHHAAPPLGVACRLVGVAHDERADQRQGRARPGVQALAESRWISIAQENRRAPIWFRLQHADQAYKAEVEARLERAGYRGEALMRSILSLIADTKECEDGSGPEFLVNPATGERLELDRYYPLHRVAFEFNGKQHYIATGPFSKREVAAQRKRDRLKQRICNEKNVKLVVVHAEDLTLRGMLRK